MLRPLRANHRDSLQSVARQPDRDTSPWNADKTLQIIQRHYQEKSEIALKSLKMSNVVTRDIRVSFSASYISELSKVELDKLINQKPLSRKGERLIKENLVENKSPKYGTG